MSRNRIIHNVQDVFVGSPEGETDKLITGVTGHQVLKRLNRVQSFNYGIDLPKEDKFTLGQSKPFSRKTNSPASVTFSLSYYLDGVNNEDRIGLNVDNENRKSSDKTKSLFYDMVESNDTNDKRNFYLVVNNETDDIHGQHVDLPHEKLAEGTFTKNDVIDPNSSGYSVVVFQNSYLTNYNISVEAGQLPNVDLSYVADNMVGYVSGSGINIPYLDLKKGEVTDNTVGVYTSDFSAGTDGWSQNEGNTSAPHTIGGETNVLKNTGNTTDGGHDSYRQNMFTIGKTYRISGKFYIDTAGGNYKGLHIYVGSQSSYEGQKFHDTKTVGYVPIDMATWVDFEVDIVANHTNLHFYPLDTNGDSTFAATTSDNFGIKDIVVTDITEAKEFIIPKHFDRSTNNKNLIDDDFLLRDGYVNVKINKVGVSGVSGIYDDSIRSCSISCSLDRDAISYVGQKMISDRPIQFPVSAELGLDTIVKENISGSFIDDINENENYNIVIDLKYQSKGMVDDGYVNIFTFSGAKFDGINYNNSIGSNKTASLKFSTITDFENDTAGVFLSGKVSSALVDLELDGGDDLVDNDGNTVVALPVYLQY